MLQNKKAKQSTCGATNCAVAVRYCGHPVPRPRDALEERGGGYPPPSRAPSLCPATVSQVPASMAFVTDSNRPQPLWQPPPTACLTAYGTVFEVPSLLVHPCPTPVRSRVEGDVPTPVDFSTWWGLPPYAFQHGETVPPRLCTSAPGGVMRSPSPCGAAGVKSQVPHPCALQLRAEGQAPQPFAPRHKVEGGEKKAGDAGGGAGLTLCVLQVCVLQVPQTCTTAAIPRSA